MWEEIQQAVGERTEEKRSGRGRTKDYERPGSGSSGWAEACTAPGCQMSERLGQRRLGSRAFNFVYSPDAVSLRQDRINLANVSGLGYRGAVDDDLGSW